MGIPLRITSKITMILLVQCLIIYNGPLRKHLKSFGTLYMIIVGIEWKHTLMDLEKALYMVYKKTFSMNSIQLGGSKALL